MPPAERLRRWRARARAITGIGVVVAAALLGAACGQKPGAHEEMLGLGAAPVAAAAKQLTEAQLAQRTDPSTARQYVTLINKVTVTRNAGAPAPAPVTVTRTVTWDGWARLLLRHIEVPVCTNNVVAVVAWEAAENTRANWNPLATTLVMPNTTVLNGHGVRNYNSLQQGLEATARTLQRGWELHGYRGIVDSLRACAPPMATGLAINASNWCRGCVSGRYVVNLIPFVARHYGLKA